MQRSATFWKPLGPLGWTSPRWESGNLGPMSHTGWQDVGKACSSTLVFVTAGTKLHVWLASKTAITGQSG